MVPILMLVSISPMLWQMGSGAPEVNDQMVRAQKNGEFLWKYYPPGALKRGEQGRVGFTLMVEPTGVISACDVTESSGFKALDAETCETMGLYAHLDPVRRGDGRAIRATTSGFIVWKLPPDAATIASASKSQTMPKPDKLICRKDTVTGSLIATVRQCLRPSEWKQQEAVNRQAIDQMGQGSGFCGGNDGPCLPPCPTHGAGSC